MIPIYDNNDGTSSFMLFNGDFIECSIESASNNDFLFIVNILKCGLDGELKVKDVYKEVFNRNQLNDIYENIGRLLERGK